jgi:hypothetical protein
MRAMKWIGVAGVVAAALVASGCASGPHKGGSGPTRGVVQVQRQAIDPMKRPVGQPVTVAYLLVDPAYGKQQWWISSEAIPIQPTHAADGSGTCVILVPDGDHECGSMDDLKQHVRTAHQPWLSQQAMPLRATEVGQSWDWTPWSGD